MTRWAQKGKAPPYSAHMSNRAMDKLEKSNGISLSPCLNSVYIAHQLINGPL